jgi:aspartyl-tRNA(Asn)/glutamyl-tRNA(Gln) amidotransferase subunit A
MRELAFSSLTELACGLRLGKYTSAELTELFLNRIDRFDASAHSYVTVFHESAMHQAKAADLQRRSGLPLPALHGLPIAVKDLCELEGQVTTAGSAAWSGRRSATTSPVMRKLLGAGMILLGKLHMSEFAFSGWGVNARMGTPRNPWDWKEHHRVPGGSSSGSAVAVAAGLAPAAIGSDTGGSVRIPAALNGVTGLKPTYGRISLEGAVPLSTSMDSIGPLARTVEDAALVTQALEFDSWNLDAVRTIRSDTGSSQLRRMRIGVMTPSQYPYAVDDEIQAATEDAERVFRSLGASLEKVELPFELPALFRNWSAITGSEVYKYHAKDIENAELPFDPWVRKRILAGKAVPGSAYVAAQEDRRIATARFDDLMRSCDLILSPTVPVVACSLAEVDEEATPLGTLTRWVNYVGGCALSLPAGFSRTGLPMGVQLIAKAWDEDLLLEAGRAFQRETDWHRRTPGDPV